MIGLARLQRGRRMEIVNLTVTEIMMLMVFVAMAFSFLAKEEGLRDVSILQRQLDEVTAERDRLKAVTEQQRRDIAQLQQEKAELERRLAQLLPYADRLQPGDWTQVPKAELARLHAEIGRLTAIVNEQQRMIEELRKQLGAEGKGSGYPNCLVTSGFLIDVVLLADGRFATRPAWGSGSEAIATALPGMAELLAGPLAAEPFKAAAGRLRGWAETQEVKCRFRVRMLLDGESDRRTFLAQQAIVDEFFYPSRPR